MTSRSGKWAAATIADLGELRLGKMLDKAKNEGRPAAYLRNVNVRWFGFALDDLQEMRVTDEEREALSVKDGDLLICEGGEPGRSAVWRGGESNLIYQKALHRFRASSAVVPELLMYFLKHEADTGALKNAFTGTTIKHLTKESLARYEIPVPPINEQKRIADKLDTVLARVDACRERLDRVPAILKRFRQSVLSAATSGRLTEDWRGDGELTGWTYEKASDVCAKVQSGGTPKEGFIGAGVPFLKVYNIVDQKVAFDYKAQYIDLSIHRGSMSKSQVLPGDVLMNIVGPPLGKVAVVPDSHPEWNINQAITLFRPSGRISTGWLYCVLCGGENIADIVHETRGSAGQTNISLSQCRNFILPVPPIEEQAEIVRRVEALFAWADRLEARLAAARSQTDRLTPSLLAKAFRGELVSQDPADEPAAELLARIAANRETGKPRARRIRSGAPGTE